MKTKERTLVLVKPDGVMRSLVGEIIKRFEMTGLKLVAIKMTVAHADHVKKHYTMNDQWIKTVGAKSIEGMKRYDLAPPTEDPDEMSQIILNTLVDYITSGPVVAMVWQGAHATEVVRKLVGGTEPLSSSIGTIRGDLVHDSYPLSQEGGRAVRNLVHASGTQEEAEQEIYHWFNDSEIFDYKQVHEEVLYNSSIKPEDK